MRNFLPKQVRPAERLAIENEIVRLIGLLDALDGDPDFEAQCEDEGFDGDSEPDDSIFVDDGFPGPIFGDSVVIDNVTPKRDYAKVPVRQLEE